MSTAGGAFAQFALDKLLQKAERAWARAAPPEGSLLFSEASLPEYFQLPLRADKDVAHAELRSVERLGAVALEWDRRAGIDGQIERMRLLDAERIATCLDRKAAWTLYAEAERQLAPWAQIPSIAHVLSRWRSGKQVRGLGSQRVADCADACKVMNACRQLATVEDVPVRRLSAALFADSKRIENITPALDILTSDALDALARDPDDVLRALGLVKFKQPVLIAGLGAIELVGGQTIPIPAPYIGLAPQSIQAVHCNGDGGYLLSVENLTTFHELAMGRGGTLKCLLIYTAGMPSPALQRVYRLCAQSREAGVQPRWHWGDIDLGGFRIAGVLAALTDSPLRLWSMDPSRYPDAASRKALSKEERSEIIAIGQKWGWSKTTRNVEQDGRAIEQESLVNELPPGRITP